MKTNKANQVAAFEKFVGFCNAQSPVYNPSKASIQVAALNTLLTQAQSQIKAADVTRVAYENAVNARQTAFSTLQQTASRIVDALVASGASAEAIAEARAITRTFHSRAKVLVTPASTTSPDGQEQGGTYRRRLSRLDMASKVQNFEKLVARLTAEPLYRPNEANLTITAITAYANLLRAQNKSVIAAYETMQKANRALSITLYDKNGIYGSSQFIKAYIRSVYGKQSHEYNACKMFHFKNK